MREHLSYVGDRINFICEVKVSIFGPSLVKKKPCYHSEHLNLHGYQ